VISASDLRKGTKILYRDEPYIVLEYQQVKPGKGGAYIRTKMKNLITGLVHEETFRSGEKFQDPHLVNKEMVYLYVDNGFYHFMDQESFEEVILNSNQLSDILDYLKEQTVYTILYFKGKPIIVTPPLFLELEVKETPPGVRGDTAQGAGTKPATLETGLVVQVPLFVEEGDIIKIDTRTGSYLERIKK
jgi:elongation factor P